MGRGIADWLHRESTGWVALAALLSLRPRLPSGAYWLGVAGAVAFCLQTAVLDLFIWTVHFPA